MPRAAPSETAKTITIEVKGDSKREASLRQQQQFAVDQDSRHWHDLERRLIRQVSFFPVPYRDGQFYASTLILWLDGPSEADTM
jgi:hypothetical protein